MAGPLMWTGFRDLWKSLKDDSARLNFIKHCFVAKEYSKSPGEYLYPGTSVFMQQAVDNLASVSGDKRVHATSGRQSGVRHDGSVYRGEERGK